MRIPDPSFVHTNLSGKERKKAELSIVINDNRYGKMDWSNPDPAEVSIYCKMVYAKYSRENFKANLPSLDYNAWLKIH